MEIRHVLNDKEKQCYLLKIIYMKHNWDYIFYYNTLQYFNICSQSVQQSFNYFSWHNTEKNFFLSEWLEKPFVRTKMNIRKVFTFFTGLYQ